MIKLVKAANDLLSKDIIYTYWKAFGQFWDKKTCTIGHYTNPVYTGSKEFLSYDTAHVTDQKMKSIMLNGMQETRIRILNHSKEMPTCFQKSPH